MSRVLLVDDEIYAIEGLKDGVDWRELGVSRLYTACNAPEAQAIYLRELIDVMVCDIEMPGGSGLDLLKWVKEHRPDTDTLFLTCHDDFRYAQQALRLGCVDYLLKPAPYGEIQEVLRKLIRQRLDTGKLTRPGVGRAAATPQGVPPRFSVVAVWRGLLLSGRSDLVESEVGDVLTMLQRSGSADSDEITGFCRDLQHMVRNALEDRGIADHAMNGVAMKDADGARPVPGADAVEWAARMVREAGRAIEVVDKANSILGRATEYIERYLTDNMSCEKVSEHLRLNADYLSRVFRKGTGLSLSDYIISAKMNVAKELLAKTRMPIGRIASHIGYTNFSHFSNIFAKIAGMSPRRFRLQHGQAGEPSATGGTGAPVGS